MPTVPRYKSQVSAKSSGTSPMKPEQGRPYYFGGREAQDIIDIGKGVTDFGKGYLSMMTRSQDRVDKTIARDNLNEAQKEIDTYMVELYRAEGKTALEAYSTAQSKLEEVRKNALSNFENTSQKEYFTNSYDQMMGKYLKNALSFQETKRVELDENTKSAQNMLYQESVRRNPYDDSLFEEALTNISYNVMDTARYEKDIDAQVKEVKEKEKEVDNAVKDLGLKEIEKEKKEAKSYYTDDHIKAYRKMTSKEQKEIGGLDASKLTPKQMELLVEDYDEFNEYWDEVVKPMWERGIQLISDFGDNVSEALSPSKDAPRPKTKPVISQPNLVQKRQIASQMSALTVARIEGLMADPKNKNANRDALLMYHKDNAYILPRDKKRLEAVLQKGYLGEARDNAITNVLERVKGKDPNQALQEIDTLLPNTKANKEAKTIFRQNIGFAKIAESEHEKKVLNQYQKIFTQSPNTPIPKQYLGSKLGDKLTGMKRRISDDLREAAGEKAPRDSNMKVLNSLLSLSYADLKKIDLNSYGAELNASDRKIIEKRQQLPEYQSKLSDKMINDTLNTIPQFNPKHSKNKTKVKKQQEAERSRSIVLREIHDAINNLGPKEVTREKIQQIIDYQMFEGSTGLFGSERRALISELPVKERIDYHQKNIPDSVLKDPRFDTTKGATEPKVWSHNKSPETLYYRIDKGNSMYLINVETLKETRYRKR
jgi:hypothetical protein